MDTSPTPASTSTTIPTAGSLYLYRVGDASRRDFLFLGWLRRSFWVVADTPEHAVDAALAASRIARREDALVSDRTEQYRSGPQAKRVTGLDSVLGTAGEVRIEIRSIPGGPKRPERWIHWPKV